MTQPSGSNNPWVLLMLGGLALYGIWNSLGTQKKHSIWDFLEQAAVQHQQEKARAKALEAAQPKMLAPPNYPEGLLPTPQPPAQGPVLDLKPIRVLDAFGLSSPPASGNHPAPGTPDLKAFPFSLDLKPLNMQDLLRALSAAPATPAPIIPPDPDARLRQIIAHPSVVLVLGKRGSGKSALGYRLLELFRYAAQPYVVGAPPEARSLLPDWIGLVPSLEEAPARSIVLVDEAYVQYHARDAMGAEGRAIGQMVNLSRQKQQTLIFIVQEARQLDINAISQADVIAVKELSEISREFERPQLRRFTDQARVAFATLQGPAQRWTWVYSEAAGEVGLVENQLASFWKPGLSRLFAGVQDSPATSRTAKAVTSQEKAARAKAMRAAGASYSEIAQALGVSRGTVVNYIRGYPYRR